MKNKQLKLKIGLVMSLSIPLIMLVTFLVYDRGNIIHSNEFNTIITQSKMLMTTVTNPKLGAYTIG